MRKIYFINRRTLSRSVSTLLIFLLLLTTVTPIIQTPLSPKIAEASNTCSAATNTPAANYSSRVGGVSLDQAATFLANMDDITGAYYDEDQDRIVFVGKKNTSLPEFDKDDLAVAIRSVIFNGVLPAVSIENNPADPTGPVVTYYYGDINNTKFGKVLIDADYKMKKYMIGYDENQQQIVSSVPGYKSVEQRYLEKSPASNPPTSGNRFVIRPDIVSLKLNEQTNSFVFDQVKMMVYTEPLFSTNDPKMNEAASEFAQHHTTNYDLFGQETPEYANAKQLGKIVSVVKWIDDSDIATDFQWARDYAPKIVPTTDSLPRITYTNGSRVVSGGAEYYTPNTYNSDDGVASSFKNASEAVNSPKEDINWTFTKDGQQYESVAVSAEAFRSLGSYSTSVTDLEIPTTGDINLAFARSYNSYSGGQNGIGRGWDMFPAKLLDTVSGTISCGSGAFSGVHYKNLSIQTAAGLYETFTFNCNSGYQPDDPSYHSKVIHESNGFYTVFLKDQTELYFAPDFKLLLVFDKNGNSLTYNYGGSDDLLSITDSENHQLTLNHITLHGKKLVSSIKDWTNRTVSYTYDDQGNLLTVTDPRGKVTTYTYDTNFKLTGIADRDNKTILTNTYTPEAKLSTHKDAGNVTTTYNYDDVDCEITKTDNLGKTEKTIYDTKARVTRQYDKAGAFSEYVYDIEYSPTHVIDRMGNLTENIYDANGNVTSITYPDEKVVTYEYDNKNRITKIIDSRYGSTPKETVNTYDAYGNLIETNESGRITTFTYGNAGELLTTTNPLNKTITWTRDSFGNRLTEKDPLNKIANFEYDTVGRLTEVTDPNNKSTAYTYDNSDNVLTETTAVGTTTYEYNGENVQTKTIAQDTSTTQHALNNARSVTSVTDALNNVTSYNYDQYQNMTSKQDALNRTTEYVYDNLNRRTEMTTPLGKVTQWEYDSNGNIIIRIDANYNATFYEYDEMDRIKKIEYQDNTNPNTTVDFTYDGRGNLLTMVDPTGSTAYEYDKYDRLTKTTDSNSEVINYEYDNADNLTKIIYPGNKSVIYAYNNAGRLASITDWNNKVTSYTYNDNGTIASRSLPNGITSDYLYDNTNKLIDINHKKSTTSLSKFSYERNNLGNIKVSTESSNTVVSPTVTPTPPPSQNDHVIYGDALGSGWENWSWGSSFNFSDTSNVHSGSNNMSWTVNSGYSSMYLHKNGNIDTEGYTHFTFALKASQSGQNVQAQLWDENGSTIGSPVSLSNYGGQPVSSGYTVYSIPLTDLDGDDRLISGVMLQDISGSAQPAMFVDSMSLKASQNNQPTTTITPTPTSAPQSTAYAYDDALSSGWESWSWGSTVDTNNTTNVHEGTKSLSWTVNSGYAGLYLHKNNNFDTTGYTDFTFALKATQANQNVQAQLWDENGNTIGSPVSLSNYGGQPTNSAYKVYTIPLQDLSGTDIEISGILLQDISGSAQPAMYVDSVGFIPEQQQQGGGSGGQTEITYDVYDEGDANNWDGGSWGSTTNFAATTAPKSGSQHISWTVDSGYAALHFYDPAGVDTTDYETLDFALQATQTGTNIAVYMTDDQNNPIGTEANLSNHGGAPTVGTYKEYSIPLSALNAENRVIKTILLQDKSGGAKPAVYADSIKLVGAVSSGSATTTTTAYTYDLLGRLLSGDYQDDDYSYTYDKVGNILTSTKNGQTATSTYNNDNQLTVKGSESFSYDDNGSQISRGSKNLAYNVDKKLTAYSDPSNAKTVQFVYDGNGERIEEKVNNTNTKQYINDVSGGRTNVLIEKDLVNNTQNYFVYGAGLTSKGGINDADRFYYLEDGLGNIRYVADSNGNIVKEYAYDPYGSLTEGSQQDFLFKGEQLNSDTGLYYMRARYYDPSIGRFISRDLLEGDIARPISQNAYHFGANDPINNSDPFGLDYLNVNFSIGTPLFIGPTGGFVINEDRSVQLYAGGGLITPGKGFSVTHSTGDAGSGWSASGNAAFGFAYGVSRGAEGSDGTIQPLNKEKGLGTPGLQFTAQYTWDNKLCK